MTDSTASRRNERAAPSPDRMALLHTMAFTALRLCMMQFDEFSTRLGDALTGAAAQSGSPDEAESLRCAAEHLNGRRVTFHRLFADCLQKELLAAVETAAAHVASGLATGAMDLSLSTFEAMERKVLIDNLSQAIDKRNADLLAILGMRVAHWLEVEEIGSAQNPFRAEIFLRAFSEAWTGFDLQTGAQRLVLRQLRPEVFLHLEPVWQALNQELAVRKVLPDAEEKYRRRTRLPESLPAPSHVDALRLWLAPEGTLKLIEARAVLLLDKTIAHLQAQDRIPPAIRALLRRLQPAVARTMLTEPDFFFDAKRPVRRLLETFLDAGLGCTPDDAVEDALYQAIAHGVAPLLSGKDIPPTEWDSARARIDAVIAQEDRKLGERISAMAGEAVKQESQARAQRLGEEAVATRIESGDVPRFLEVFLQTQWSRVVAFAHGVADTRPEVLDAVLKAMDDLIASVQPKSGAEARKGMVESLPALLGVLNAWLNVVKWEGAEREAFFSALAERQATALRGPADLSPRAQLEARMNAMQKASEHELGRRIQEQQVAALADCMRLIDALAPGRWAEFVRNDGSRLNCKLMWISPARGRFIFTGRHGQLVFTLADEALAHALRAERVAFMPSDGLFTQALAETVSASVTGY
ncbi:MAG TPA: DUF1631 family protein [Noviherbaspirillum sp.]